MCNSKKKLNINVPGDNVLHFNVEILQKAKKEFVANEFVLFRFERVLAIDVLMKLTKLVLVFAPTVICDVFYELQLCFYTSINNIY